MMRCTGHCCRAFTLPLLVVGFVSIGSAIAFKRKQRKNLDAALAAEQKGKQL